MTMDKETEAALRASIKHWEENVAAERAEDVSTDAADCALCREFPGCSGCPVAAAVGVDGCQKTPYDLASIALDDWHAEQPGAGAAFKQAATEELDFLKSLLPEGRQPDYPLSGTPLCDMENAEVRQDRGARRDATVPSARACRFIRHQRRRHLDYSTPAPPHPTRGRIDEKDLRNNSACRLNGADCLQR